MGFEQCHGFIAMLICPHVKRMGGIIPQSRSIDYEIIEIHENYGR